MLRMEEGKAVWDGGCEGLAGGICAVGFGEYGGLGSAPVDGDSESLLTLLFLVGVLLDMLFASNVNW